MWRFRYIRYRRCPLIQFLLTRADGLRIQDLFLRDLSKGGERRVALFSICDSAGFSRAGIKILPSGICTTKEIRFVKFCVLFYLRFLFSSTLAPSISHLSKYRKLLVVVGNISIRWSFPQWVDLQPHLFCIQCPFYISQFRIVCLVVIVALYNLIYVIRIPYWIFLGPLLIWGFYS